MHNMPHRPVLVSTHYEFALDVVARRPRLIKSNIEYVILATWHYLVCVVSGVSPGTDVVGIMISCAVSMWMIVLCTVCDLMLQG